MKTKIVTAALAAIIAGSSFGVASAAPAPQVRHQGPAEHGANGRGPADHGPAARGPVTHGPATRGPGGSDHRVAPRPAPRPAPPVVRAAPRPAQVQAYGRWQAAPRRYTATRWQQPRGYDYRVYGYGQRLPTAYNSYVINDYSRYGLRTPPRGYHYVRNGNDVVLAAVAGGLITAVIAGLFN